MVPSGDIAMLLCLLLVSAMSSLTLAQVCPERCDCAPGDGGTIVHCKYQRKTGFPPLEQFPVDTVELDYESNNISTLSALPALGNLQRLNLDNCEIHTISANAFINVPALKNITLKKNKIDSLDRFAFSGLSNLEGLYMEDNRLGAIPDGVFDSLNLVDLYLDGSSIHSLSDNTFSGLRLQHLYMKRNNISYLTAGYLRPLRDTLVSFHLDNNQHDLQIDVDSFAGFNSLEALSLRSSKIMDISFLSEVNVKSLYLSGNMFPELDLRPYPNLASVETLELKDMGLRTFQADKILSHFSSLRKLDLSNNDMTGLESLWFSVTPLLSELILRGNKLTELPLDFGENLNQITTLDLAMNHLAFLEQQSFAQMRKLKTLNLARNKIRTLPESLKPLFNQVTSLSLFDNLLHCNCEMLWYRDFLATTPNGNFETQCNTPVNTYIFNLQREQFECKAPTFVSMETLVYIPPGEDLLLICRAEGDPAPTLEWMDRYNDSITVSPSHDRSILVNSNVWQLNSVTEEYSGTYVCTASSIAGKSVARTEVIVTDKIPSTAAPTPPPPTTSSSTEKTTSETEKPVTTATTGTSPTPKTIPSKKPSTSNTGATTSATGSKKAVIDQKTLAIIIGSVGGFLILCVVIFLLVHILRHNRHKQKYEVNDKAVIYHHDTNELDISKDSKQINV